MKGALLKSDIISGLLTFWKILWRVGLFFLVWGLLLVPFLVPFTSALFKWKQTSSLEARLYGDVFFKQFVANQMQLLQF
jgi:hypothetical protein